MEASLVADAAMFVKRRAEEREGMRLAKRKPRSIECAARTEEGAAADRDAESSDKEQKRQDR